MKKRHQFTEKPPSMDDPDWTSKFADWVVRKAAHNDMGPMEFIAAALGCNKKDRKRAKALDEKAHPASRQAGCGLT